MGVVSEVLGNHGELHRIEHNGKTYRMSRIDQRVKSSYEEALFARARRSLAVTKDLLSEQEYQKRLSLAISRFEAGEYELFSERGQAFMKTPVGFRLLLSLIIDCDENELLALLIAKKDELVPMVGLILRESFPGMVFKADAEGDAQNAQSTPPAPLRLTEPDEEPSRTWKEAAQQQVAAEAATVPNG